LSSQYLHVKNQELLQIRDAITAALQTKKLSPTHPIKLTAVVVTKMHNTRNFPQSSEKCPAMETANQAR